MNRPGNAALAACIRTAAAQHGVITIDQVLAAGLSIDAAQRLVTAGSWRRLHPCVYALWTPEATKDRWAQCVTGGALWLGEGSAVSHRAAAVITELLDDGPAEFSTTGRRRCAGLVIHRVKVLPPDDIVVRHGIRVTSVARTLVDLTAVADAATVELALETALRRRQTTRRKVADALARSGDTHPGRAALRALLDHTGAVTESMLEARVWQLLRDERMPLPIRQYVIRESGSFVARVDFAYPNARVAIEADGYEFHSSRRDWRRDRLRQNALLRLGWMVYRVTWEDVVHHGPRVAADLRVLLATRSSHSG